jgi:hypothetical protein
VAYNYLLEIYETIAQRRGEAQASADAGAGAGADTADTEYQRGRIDALDELEQFLKANYHSRLPRRIRARFEPGPEMG